MSSNKGMKLTSVERNGRSQLLPSVRRTLRRSTERRYEPWAARAKRSRDRCCGPLLWIGLVRLRDYAPAQTMEHPGGVAGWPGRRNHRRGSRARSIGVIGSGGRRSWLGDPSRFGPGSMDSPRHKHFAVAGALGGAYPNVGLPDRGVEHGRRSLDRSSHGSAGPTPHDVKLTNALLEKRRGRRTSGWS